ncbi:MAG: hypothetical protein ACYCV7_13635 [Acidimicrobiales bacterium]|jgi:hypothetical protein
MTGDTDVPDTTPVCPGCNTPLDRVVDLPYGYWEWDGGRYRHRYSASGPVVPEFACARCLGGLPEFHPEDHHYPATSG